MTTTRTRTVSRCSCGKRKSRYATRCKTCDKAHTAKYRADAIAIISTGKCPQCGRALKRNLAIFGWWQCEQYGASTHRADATAPACSYQITIPRAS